MNTAGALGIVFDLLRALNSSIDAGELHGEDADAVRATFERFDRVLVPEMNNGQLVKLLRAEYLIPAESLPKVTGKPFRVTEIAQAIRNL